MTAIEKALELIDIYEDKCPEYIQENTAKWCALIAVDEMINYLELNGFSTQIEYWKEVKQEI